MSTIPLTKQSVENAGDLDFPERKREATIQIEVSSAGLTVKVAYSGSLDSIPQAIERLRAAGILELVSGAPRTPAASNGATGKQKTANTAPVTYDDGGTPICGIHHRPMRESDKAPGSWYCTAKVGEGYCKERA